MPCSATLTPAASLPVTFPRVVGQVPLYYNHLNTGRPATERKYTSQVHRCPRPRPSSRSADGLSYTRFQLKDLLPGRPAHPGGGDSSLVSVAVENVGDCAGDEVVQLYIRDVAASVPRPVRELRG